MCTMQGLYLCTVLCLVVLVRRTHSQEEVALNTTLGLISGRTLSGLGPALVDVFLGIPYASPPVGELRFAPPVPLKGRWGNFTEVLDASRYAPACPQPVNPRDSWTNNTDEDCLYLNVFSPKVSSSAGLPVLVFIHGGALRAGAAQMNDPTVLAGEAGVVVVTLNYRLGPFGFLSTGDDHCPGNYGLLDQVVALEWVRDNIADYRGDPEQVTLAGHSAGAGSVTLHMVSPMSKDLFHGAIAMAGMYIFRDDLRGSTNEANARAKQVADHVGCDVTSSMELITCLRKKPVEDLVSAGTKVRRAWVFREDGKFLPSSPDKLWKEGYFARVPFLLGGEPVLDISGEHANETQASMDVYVSRVQEMTSSLGADVGGVVDDAIMYEYRDWNQPDNPVMLNRQLNKMNGDVRNAATDKAIKLFAELALEPAPTPPPTTTTTTTTQTTTITTTMATTVVPDDFTMNFTDMSNSTGSDMTDSQSPTTDSSVTTSSEAMTTTVEMTTTEAMTTTMEPYSPVYVYRYLFNYISPESPSPPYAGVRHGDELMYLFGEPLGVSTKQIWTNKDQDVSRQMMGWFGTFIKTGQPTPDNTSWPAFTQTNQIYTDIADPVSLKSHYRQRQVAFWDIYKPQLVDKVRTIAETAATATPETEPTAEPEPSPYFIATWILLAVVVILLLLMMYVLCCAYRAKNHSYDVNSSYTMKSYPS